MVDKLLIIENIIDYKYKFNKCNIINICLTTNRPSYRPCCRLLDLHQCPAISHHLLLLLSRYQLLHCCLPSFRRTYPRQFHLYRRLQLQRYRLHLCRRWCLPICRHLCLLLTQPWFLFRCLRRHHLRLHLYSPRLPLRWDHLSLLHSHHHRNRLCFRHLLRYL